jgi:hypothetical protein
MEEQKSQDRKSLALLYFDLSDDGEVDDPFELLTHAIKEPEEKKRSNYADYCDRILPAEPENTWAEHSQPKS